MQAIFRFKTQLLTLSALMTLAVTFGCATKDLTSDAGVAINKADTAANKGDESSGTHGTSIGNTAPDFQLANTNGTPVSLDSLRGQPAVLVFWTAWCPSCKEEAPHINELAAKYEAQGVRVLGILPF